MTHEQSTPAPTSFLNEEAWKKLIRRIHLKQVLPVIGPEIVTVPGPDGQQVPLYCSLAGELAKKLKEKQPSLSLSPDSPLTLSDVAIAWLLGGGDNDEIYLTLGELVPQELKEAPIPHALLALASITDFDLYISTTFDPLLERALIKTNRPYRQDTNRRIFHPNEQNKLPHPLPNPFLYHILGTYEKIPDFVVWEEDYIEYIFGLLLQKENDNLKDLFKELKTRDLLLIGSPFNDWIVQLFLRVVKDKRFSFTSKRKDYIAEEPAKITKPTIFFYQKDVGSTRIIPGNPRTFAIELANRWKALYSFTTIDDVFEAMGNDIPQGSIFISYSHDDMAAAIELARGLMTAGIPVWMDRGRLTAGENYERSLEHAIKDNASFFISLISSATEARKDRYVHRERKWAAECSADGYVFYIPVLIEELPSVELEQQDFAQKHRWSLPDGKVTASFVERMNDLLEQYRDSGRPKD